MTNTKARAQFEAWLDYLPDFLAAVPSLFPPGKRRKLDFSPASLDVVEAWILDRYPDPDSMLGQTESQTVNLLACYIGETIRRAASARWDVQLESEYAYYGVPVLVLPNGDTECPLTLATASADRRTGTFLRSVLDVS